ncbi:MAG TPA: peptidase inhibitor family I36 protein [Micromonosporaceae bacterium]
MWIKYEEGTRSRNKAEIDWWNGDDEISSLSNKTSIYLVVFADDNWNGSWKCINPYTNLSSLSGSWNDNIESFYLDDDCVFCLN